MGMQRNVHVDLAVEMQIPGRSLYFRTEGHEKILERLLGYTTRRAERMTTCYGQSALYQRDLMCSLSALSGFHMNLRGDAGPNGVLYAQAYHTEKEIAYQASSANKIVALQKIELLRDQNQERANSLHGWINSCVQALLAQVDHGFPNSARFEVTSPMNLVEARLVNFPDDLLTDALVALPLDTIP